MTRPTKAEGQSTWRLDRTISPALLLSGVAAIAALGSQSYVALTWANAMTAQVEEIKRESARVTLSVEQGDKRILDRGDERYRGITIRLDGLERDRAGDRERLVKVEEQFRWVAEALGRIERKLDGSSRR